MILEEIAVRTRVRVEEEKQQISLEEMKKMANEMDANTGFPFRKALGKEELSFLSEVKKASPSKGLIAETFPYIEIAKDYEKAGASAISCLTEPYYFQGSDRYLTEIAKQVSIPILRKDFVVDAYQIYQAKVIGASAVLLICAILERETIKAYIKIAESLGMDALVEAHDEREIEDAIGAGAKIIGVNNRNLKDFTVDITNSIRLRKFVPKEILFVSESGMKTAEDIKKLKENGIDAVLIGETLMRSENKKEMLETLNGGPL